jgi:hypothetical protein
MKALYLGSTDRQHVVEEGVEVVVVAGVGGSRL